MNSSPERYSAYYFIDASLSMLRRECLPAYAMLCRQMDGRTTLLTIEDEPVRLAFFPDQIEVTPSAANGLPDIGLSAAWSTIHDLVNADITLIDAIFAGRFDLLGESNDLALFYEALLTYLRGAVRCPSFPALLDQLRLAHPHNILT